MKTRSFILAVLVSTTTVAWGGTAAATTQRTFYVPGTACRMLNNSTNAEVTGTTFSGTAITNNTTSTNMNAICPLMPIESSGTASSYTVYVYGSGLTSCYLGLLDSNGGTTHFYLGSNFLGPWYWGSFPITSYGAVVDCYMGANSKLVNIVVTYNQAP